MTELNKQWYEGTLEKDKYYYAKDSSEGDCIVHINKSNELTFTGWEVPYKPDQSNVLEPFKLRTELLERVPSYEEWLEKTKSLKVLAEAYCKEKQKNDEIKQQLAIAVEGLERFSECEDWNEPDFYIDKKEIADLADDYLKQIKELI